VAAQRYDEVRGIDWRWLAVDGCLTKAPLSRSEVVGRNPTNRNDHRLMDKALEASAPEGRHHRHPPVQRRALPRQLRHPRRARR
jgi:hypothetical protein